jgi:hypothetical protein
MAIERQLPPDVADFRFTEHVLMKPKTDGSSGDEGYNNLSFAARRLARAAILPSPER